MPNSVAPFPHTARDSSHSSARFRQKLAIVMPVRQNVLWMVLGFVLLPVGLAAFMVSPKLGIMALGLPAFPSLVLYPPQALMLVIALVPFDAVAGLGPSEGTTLTKLVALAVMAGWVVRLLIRRQHLRLGAAGMLLAAHVAFGAASALWTVDRAATFAQLYSTAQLLLFYIMVVNLMASPATLERTLNVLIASAVVIAGLLLWQLSSTAAIQSGHFRATVALRGAQFNPNGVATIVVLPALAAMALGRAASFPRWWRFASFVPLAAAALLTGSRGGGLALFTGLVVLGFMRPRLGIRISGFVLATAIVLTLVVPEGYLEQITQRYTKTAENRGSGRLDIWAVSVAMIKDHPFQGCGFGGFNPAFYRYMADAQMDPRFALAHRSGGLDAHSVYLANLAELGIFGAGIFFVALAAHYASVLHAFHSARRTGNVQALNVSLAMLCMLSGLLVIGLTGNFNLTKASWLVLALCQATGLVLSPTMVKRSPA